ncbi:hypothetical protein NBRC116587_20170 [Pseudoteredinibacter isoporae]
MSAAVDMKSGHCVCPCLSIKIIGCIIDNKFCFNWLNFSLEVYFRGLNLENKALSLYKMFKIIE